MTKKKKRQEIPPQVASRAQTWLEGLVGDPDAALAALIKEASSDEEAATAFVQLLAAHPGEETAYVAARAGQTVGSKAVRKEKNVEMVSLLNDLGNVTRVLPVVPSVVSMVTTWLLTKKEEQQP